MADRPIRVLIVDDSALMRMLLGEMLSSSPEIEVVAAARGGEEALDLAARLRPDVVTLDVEMPGLSGLEVLPRLLEIARFPVVMVSAWTREGADVTIAALELGAVDFLPKPAGGQLAALRAAQDQLVSKVRIAAGSRVRTPRPAPAAAEPPTASSPIVAGHLGTRCIVIGISTGGPQTLTRVFSEVEPPLPPILVVQHMPAGFTQVFAARLDRRCRLPVLEATEGQRVMANQILIAPGGRHLSLIGRPPITRISLTSGPPVSGHRPSIDVLFQSAAEVYGGKAIGLIMTGMGRDGVAGCRAILEAGGRTLGQDEDSSVIYGMNKAAFEAGVVGAQFSADDLALLLRTL